MIPAHSFRGKKVAVFGLARSGISCALALQLGGAAVHAWDDAGPAVATARSEGVTISNLHEVDFGSLDALVLSPGVPLTHPEPHWTVQKARAAGIEVIGDTEVFVRELEGSGAKLIAITGTNGKSTTTALTAHVLKTAGLDVEMGGNIGLAVLNLNPPRHGRHYVLEFSSFQLDLMPTVRPDVGILTNITPDHLDRHATMENYAAVKARIFSNQRDSDAALVGVDDHWSAGIAEALSNKGRNASKVSVENMLGDGISVTGGVIERRRHGQVLDKIDISTIPSLRGKHNWQNAAMAYGAASALGVPLDRIADGMRTFPGLAHRMQQVAQRGHVIFVNDSKATNADAAEKALSSFENIFWIAGGIAKSGGIEPLAPLFPRITKAYLIGLAAKEFASVLAGRVPYEMSETLNAAVAQAAQDAANSRAGQAVVLLSPACSSFDQYKNFEVRGDAFVSLVERLPGIQAVRIAS